MVVCRKLGEGQMSFIEELAKFREERRKQLPSDIRSAIDRFVNDLERSGVDLRAARVGEPAPDFVLPNQAGRTIALRSLLGQGPLVVVFYRGGW
jgi:hypothetical protein